MLKIEITPAVGGSLVDGYIAGTSAQVCKEFKELGLQIMELYPEDMSKRQFNDFMVDFGDAMLELTLKYIELHNKE